MFTAKFLCANRQTLIMLEALDCISSQMELFVYNIIYCRSDSCKTVAQIYLLRICQNDCAHYIFFRNSQHSSRSYRKQTSYSPQFFIKNFNVLSSNTQFAVSKNNLLQILTQLTTMCMQLSLIMLTSLCRLYDNTNILVTEIKIWQLMHTHMLWVQFVCVYNNYLPRCIIFDIFHPGTV